MKKKILMAIAVIAVLTAGVVTLSAFTTLSKSEKTESSKNEMNGDCSPWKLFRENVAYCDGDKDICSATRGYIWLNMETTQAAFSFGSSCNTTRYDLTPSSAKDGYNMRFWYNSKYNYVNVYIPESAWR